MVELKKKCLDNFINGINKDFKWDFDPFYLDSKYNMDGFSFLYFYKYIIKRSNNVIDEIKENLLFMNAEKHLDYLNYVEERIKRDVVSNVDRLFLNKWIKKYNISNLEFPFLKNPDLKIKLSIAIDEYKGFVPPEDQETMQIQKDFHHYAYYLGKNKIIDFIDKLLASESTKQQSEVPGKEIVVDSGANDESEKSADTDHSDLNDYTKSTIEDCLFNIVDDINPKYYKILVDALYSYFTTGKFPKLENKIKFKKVNKKKVGWALKEAYMNITLENLKTEYFIFAKDNINIFSKEVIETTDFNKSKFYKIFTTNPAK